jgi:hypothetical protein
VSESLADCLSHCSSQILAAPEFAITSTRDRSGSQNPYENVNHTGPWLQPQVQSTSASLSVNEQGMVESLKEACLNISVSNSGQLSAYPARIELQPDIYSVLWDDNYFWLAPGAPR